MCNEMRSIPNNRRQNDNDQSRKKTETGDVIRYDGCQVASHLDNDADGDS